jgi:hypothetical protein
MKIEEFEGSAPAFRPEEYFLGDIKAWGFFQDRFGAIRREFVVEIEGTMDGDVLVLDERFEYRDGEKDRRVWRITKTGEGEYEGTADDIVGIARGRAVGRAMRWEYEHDLQVGDSTWRVRFDDWMFLQDDRVMMNRSTIYKFGFKLGDVVIFFDKLSARESKAALDQIEHAAE